MNPLALNDAVPSLRLPPKPVRLARTTKAPDAGCLFPPRLVIWNLPVTAPASDLTLVNVVFCVVTQEKAPAPGLVLVGTPLTVTWAVSACDTVLVLAAVALVVTVAVIALAPTRLLEMALAVVNLAVIPSGSMIWIPPILGKAVIVNALDKTAFAVFNLPPFTATLTVDVKVAVPLVGGITSADAETATDDSSAALVVLCILVGAAETVLTAVIVAPVVFSYPPMVNTLAIAVVVAEPVLLCPPLG